MKRNMTDVKFEAQPDFPYNDVSTGNASNLVAAMRGKSTIDQYHERAVKERPYWNALKAIHESAGHHIADPELHATMLTGMKIYEAMAVAIQPARYVHVQPIDIAVRVPLFQYDLTHNFYETLSVVDEFEHEMPRTTIVIGICAMALAAESDDYILAGAALARKLEIETRPR